MKPAGCTALYHAGSVPEITVWNQLRRLPLLQNLLRKVKHTLRFCTETASHADKSPGLTPAAYFNAKLENRAAEDVDAWSVGVVVCLGPGSRALRATDDPGGGVVRVYALCLHTAALLRCFCNPQCHLSEAEKRKQNGRWERRHHLFVQYSRLSACTEGLQTISSMVTFKKKKN